MLASFASLELGVTHYFGVPQMAAMMRWISDIDERAALLSAQALGCGAPPASFADLGSEWCQI